MFTQHELNSVVQSKDRRVGGGPCWDEEGFQSQVKVNRATRLIWSKYIICMYEIINKYLNFKNDPHVFSLAVGQQHFTPLVLLCFAFHEENLYNCVFPWAMQTLGWYCIAVSWSSETVILLVCLCAVQFEDLSSRQLLVTGQQHRDQLPRPWRGYLEGKETGEKGASLIAYNKGMSESH